MRNRRALFLLFGLMAFPVWGYQQPTCVAPDLSDKQVKGIVDKERATRTDLPAPFPEYKWIVRKQGCHYVYIEYSLPETPEANHVFKLNQYGVIVDAKPGKLKCPEKVLTEIELAAIVRNERARRKDLPQAFSNSKARVDRLRCLYLYSEYDMTETGGNYQVFTIDAFGELMEVFRNKP